MSVNVPPAAEPVMQRLFAAWTRGVLKHAYIVLTLLVMLSAAAAWFTVHNLDINTSTSDMISADTPFRRNAIEYDRAFPHFSDLIVVIIDASTADAATEMANALASALRKNSGLFSRVEFPAGDPFFKRNGLLYLGDDELTTLSNRLAAAEPFLATLAQKPDLGGLFEFLGLTLREDAGAAETNELAMLFDRISGIVEAQAENRPARLAWRELIDTAGEANDKPARQIVIAHPELSGGGLSPGAPALAEIRRLAAEIRNDRVPDATIRLTGSVALEAEELQSVALGGEKAGLLTLGLVVLLLIIGLRSFRLILPAIITLVIGLVWTAAFAALTIGHLNLISVAFAVLFIGLGVDFSIHYCLYYRERAADDPNGALPATGAGVGGSLAIGALCAAAGFLSFLPTDYKGLAELGLISGGGMAIAFFLNMTMLPAILAVLPGKTGGKAVAAKTSLPFARRHYRPILLTAAATGVAAAVVAPLGHFDFNPMNLKDPGAESVAAFHDLAGDPRNGVYAIDILSTSLERAKVEAARFLTLPEVGSTVTLHSFVPENQAEKLTHIEDMSYFLAPVLTPGPAPVYDPIAATAAIQNFKRAAASYLRDNPKGSFSAAVRRLDRALQSSRLNNSSLKDLNLRLTGYLPGMLDDLRTALEAAPVGIDDIPPHIKEDWVAADGRARIQLRPASPMTSNADLQHFASAILTAAPSAVGTPVTISEAGNAVVKAFIVASIIAFALVSGILIVLLRNLTGLVLVMVPVTLAAILTGGTSVALNLPFNFANIIVLPLLFGLGVASGVHMVVRNRHTDPSGDVMQTSTPRAILFSALTTIASFGSLALSGHLGMTSMGQLLTIAIGYTLICMLLVLPALMTWVDRRTG